MPTTIPLTAMFRHRFHCFFLLAGAVPALVGSVITPLAAGIEPPIVGADISFLPSQEDRGATFSDEGVEKGALEILAAHKFNWIRLRLFVDPTAENGYSKDGYCGLEQTLAMAKRIKRADMKFLLDFHYSDTWADPGKQFTPAAWQGLDDDELAEKIHQYTLQTTRRFIEEGAAPEMIQIGNEIHNGFVWPQGRLPGNEAAFGTCLRRAAEAVREAGAGILIMVHPALGGDNGRSVRFFDLVLRHNVDFDVIGQSYYPEHHGTLDALRRNLTDLATRYRKPVVVVEYKEHAKEVNEIVRDLPEGLGWGTFIWEATSPRWGGLFDREGRTTAKIDIYPEFVAAYGDGHAPADDGAGVRVIRDIAYREGGSPAWRLDLAMPGQPSDKPRPALIIIHGGGWRGGSRTVDVFQDMMMEYAAKGYVTVNVDYRLLDEAPFPACIEDVKTAVRWLRAHAGEYNVDPGRIGAYGHSAGGHLALMLAMTAASAGLEGDGGWGDFPSRVNVVVGGSPPTELGRDVPMAKREWWPVGYISGDQPPMLLIQGGEDRIVRAELTEDFVGKMKAAGADIEYLRIDGGGHGVAYDEALEITAPAIEEFFAKHLALENPPAAAAGATEAAGIVIENGGTGPHPAVATEDATLPGMTIFRPRDLRAFGAARQLPVLLWGNGACANTAFEHKNFLNELASHGYLVLAIGRLDQLENRGEAARERTRAEQLLGALDWIFGRHEEPGNDYTGRIDVSKIAAMGMSCGGLQAIRISADPRITTTVVCNSGVLPEPSPLPGMPPLSKEILDDFHGPVLYLMGGPSDIAYPNAMDDFARVRHVPIAMANLDVGHAGTYARPHGGKYTAVALAWLDWHLKGQAQARRTFLDENSPLRRDPAWKVEVKNFGP